jgi:hypothetical protein
MKTKSRIASIIKANSLDSSLTGFPTFHLSALELPNELDFELPTNIRLGHLAEKIVAQLIKSSVNYRVVYENIQIIEQQKTIREIDFIIESLTEKKLIHLELAYKFYLFDPSISQNPINNWIGPNRNDSLRQKLDKLKTKQFPLLHHRCTALQFKNIDLSTVSQNLCLLVSLFVPYNLKTQLAPVYQQAIKGYYLDFATFTSLDTSAKKYYLPSKKEWGIAPSEHEIWTDYAGIESPLKISMHEKQAVLCWQKCQESYLSFFIVWW